MSGRGCWFDSWTPTSRFRRDRNPLLYENVYRGAWVNQEQALRVRSKLDSRKGRVPTSAARSSSLPVSAYKWPRGGQGEHFPSDGPDGQVDTVGKGFFIAQVLLRVERDLWGVLGGPWAGGEQGSAQERLAKGVEHHRSWVRRVGKSTTDIQEMKGCARELVAALPADVLPANWALMTDKQTGAPLPFSTLFIGPKEAAFLASCEPQQRQQQHRQQREEVDVGIEEQPKRIPDFQGSPRRLEKGAVTPLSLVGPVGAQPICPH